MPTLPTPALPTSAIPGFYGLTRERLGERLASQGVPAYRASQLFTWIYRKRQRDPAAMTNLPLAFRRDVARLVDLSLPAIASHLATPDGDTHKLVLTLGDDRRVECVSMRAERGLTFCLSS